MVENLTTEQTENMLRFLLHRMGLETRGALMAEMPVAYSRLYPSVSADILIGKVREALSDRPTDKAPVDSA